MASAPTAGIIELDRDGQFRTAKIQRRSRVREHDDRRGRLGLSLRCTINGGEGGAVASGRIRCAPRRWPAHLTKGTGTNDIDADGRNYRISYQSSIPSLAVHLGNAGSVNRLHLASAGKEQTFESATSPIGVPGSQLHEGTYSYWNRSQRA